MFNIENLSNLNNTQSFTNFITEIDSNSSKSNRFKLSRSCNTFIIENIDKCEDPTETLGNCFDYLINKSISSSPYNPDHIGITISSKQLTSDIYHPIRPIDNNISENLLNLFMKVSQSKEEASLFGAPFTVTITTINKKDLPDFRKTFGSGPLNNNSKLSLIHINNFGNKYCLFYALEIMRMYISKEFDRRQFYKFIRSPNQQRPIINKFMKSINVPLNQPGYDVETWGPIVQKFYNVKYGIGTYNIFVFDKYHKKPIYKSSPYSCKYSICLFYHNNHFDGIKCLRSFFNKYYCLSCFSTYSNISAHSNDCAHKCKNCSRIGYNFPCKSLNNYKKYCSNCNKTFLTQDCYNHHLKSNYCNNSKKCNNCGVIYRTDNGHLCFHKYCNKCQDLRPYEHQCYIPPYKLKKNPKPYRLIAFDFEAQQIPNDNDLEHKVNFICAKIVCSLCISNNSWHSTLTNPCDICGPHRTITWSPFSYFDTKVDFQIATLSPLDSFVSWLLNLNSQYKTYIYSHYGGRYDIMFIYGNIVNRGIIPGIIRQGNRLYELCVPNEPPKLIFRDFYNHVPQSLDSLVTAFNLNIDPKPHFPHMYNRSENYNITLPHLPELKHYLPDSKKEKEKIKLIDWYNKNYDTPFNLKEQLASYCVNDVNILLHAMIALQDKFYASNHINILVECKTIASACMKNFKANFMKPNHLAIVPETGYDKMRNQSHLALKFLSYYSIFHNVNVQTSQFINGEKCISVNDDNKYYLDGYMESLNRGIEVHGCYYHGCDKCYKDEDMVLVGGKTTGKLREETKKKEDFIREHMDLEVYWECEIKEGLRKNKEMKKHFDDYVGGGRLRERDCFFGGRTGPMKIYQEVKPGYKISYKDFTSLYPTVNFFSSYPVGHPKVIKFNYSEQVVNWTKSSDNPYKGLLKVLVSPPRDLLVPILPIRFDERLLFSLCRTCSLMYPEGGRIDNYKCTHTDKEREMVFTCTHRELNKALERKYIVTRVFTVFEYENWDDNLFKDYVRLYYKNKTEASGWPAGIDTPEKQDKYVEETKYKFGIELDKENMKKNDGIKTISKLSLNSLWGRFSLRNSLSKTILTDEPAELKEYMNDVTKDCTVEYLEKNDMVSITYTTKEEFIEEHDSSNVIISLWTTSEARLKLLEALECVAATPDCTILYMDTDSIIYMHPIDNDPLPTGPHLGDLTDEELGNIIIEFVSAGCKNYGYKYIDKNEEIKTKLKIRGFSLDANASEALNYEIFKQKTLDNDPEPIVVHYDNCLRPSLKEGTVFTKQMNKNWRPVISKGIVKGHDIVPFGYG